MAYKIMIYGLIISGQVSLAMAFRSPAQEGHSEFLEKCTKGLEYHPLMQTAPQSVRESSVKLCECAQSEFDSSQGSMEWPHFDRHAFLKSLDQCLLPLAVTGPEEYRYNGSILFDLWVLRDLDQKLVAREPAGIGHFVALENLMLERECIREGIIEQCFNGSLSQTYRCIINKVSDPEQMNDWQQKCRLPSFELPML